MSSENQPPKVKQRSVRLTAEALDLLNATVEERWRLSKARGKLTRQTQSEMLGVSLPTLDKILKREKVDRASLTTAFKAVGITWRNNYFECEADPSEEEDSGNRRTLRRTLQVPLFTVLALLAASMAIGAVVLWPKKDWTPEYDQELTLATDLFSRGSYDESEAHLAKAMELAESKKATRDLEAALKLRGDIAASRGRLSAASEYYKATIRYRELRGKPIWPTIHEVLAGLQIRIRDFDEARKNLDIAETGFTKGNEPNGIAEVMRDRGCLAAAQGQHDQALEWFAKCLQLLTTLDAPDMAIDVRGERAMTLVHFGRLDEAHKELEACLSHWSKGGHKGWIALTEMRLGQLESKMGNRGSALRRLKHARESFKSLGNVARIKEAERVLNLL